MVILGVLLRVISDAVLVGNIMICLKASVKALALVDTHF